MKVKSKQIKLRIYFSGTMRNISNFSSNKNLGQPISKESISSDIEKKNICKLNEEHICKTSRKLFSNKYFKLNGSVIKNQLELKISVYHIIFDILAPPILGMIKIFHKYMWTFSTVHC